MPYKTTMSLTLFLLGLLAPLTPAIAQVVAERPASEAAPKTVLAKLMPADEAPGPRLMKSCRPDALPRTRP